MKKIYLLFIVFVCIGFFIFTGQNYDSPKWSQGPVTTPLLGNGYNSSNPLLSNNFVFTYVPRFYYSPSGVQAVNPSVRIHPSTVFDQSEVYLACGRGAYQNVLYGSSNAVNMSASKIFDGCYVSTNSGLTWYGSDTTPCGNLNIQRGDVAPIVAKDGRLVITHLASLVNFGGLSGMAAEYSTDFGVTFSTPYQISSSASVDKNLTGTDDSPSSPYYGNSYIAYVDYTAGPWTSYFSRTTNGGVSWTTPMAINVTPSGKYAQGHDVDAMPDGTVIVVWTVESNVSPWAATGYGIARSTNGGASFTANENAFNAQGIRTASFNGWGVRINDFPRISIDKSGGPRNGWIYVVHPQINLAPAGTDPDIILNKSTDGGLTWSTGTRVNQDAMNNGKVQWFPAVNVDAYGGVNVIYYDNRYWANSGDSCTVFLARSIDGGNTWTENKLADHAFKPKPQAGMAGGYMGDYIGVTSGNNKVWGIWMDDVTGKYQAWVASVDLGPSIDHTPLMNTEQTTGIRAVNCIINPAGSPIVTSLTKLFVAKNAGAYDSVQMTNSSGNNWTGNITLSGPATYKYYLRTVDNLNRVATAPAGAPGSFYSFQAMPDTVKPVIAHTPLLDCPKLAWPSTVTASVTDNIGVDSVWVNWKKGANGTSKRFRLLFTSGNSYSAAFNSTQPEVNYNDTIFYRVIAQDISSNHNRDSSSQYHFKILSQTTACLGTGTVAMGSASGPFNTYWYGNRTNLLYLASEIMANQGAAGSITKIGFQISVVGGQAMNGLNIKMQNTTLTALTGFTSTGWTTVYSGTYTVPGTGWQYIDLTTPYVWNGTSNLLVEICFENTSYTTATTVLGTTMTGMENTEYHDLSTACSYTGFTTPVAQTARANTCFVINTLVGVNNNNTSIIPEIYTLNQNYPNPFNPVTQIKYGIPKQGLVTMKIYDVLGREITKLVNEVKSPGSYIVDFDGTNLSSGVYFYKLEVNGFNDVKRMMLIK